MRSKPPRRLKLPKIAKSGVATTASGSAGTFKFHPFGFTPSGPTNGPILNADSTAIATIVVTVIPISKAPLIFLTVRPIIKKRPKAKTTTGQPIRFPLSPRVTGTGPVLVLRTKPASTKPIRAINNPIPTEMAIFNWVGTARKTATLNPVSTRIRIIIPSRTTSPIASAQVIFVAIPTATKVFKPRPVAIASGKLATTPMRIVITPAIRAVAAATSARFGASPPPIYLPSASFARPMISGFSATM